MTKGHRGNTYVCSGGNFVPKTASANGSLAVGPIVGDVDGKTIQMNITKISYHGPGSYDAGGVSFNVGSDHYFPANAPSGTLTVSQDGRGGTVKIELAKNSAPGTVVAHVEGAWHCPADGF